MVIECAVIILKETYAKQKIILTRGGEGSETFIGLVALLELYGVSKATAVLHKEIGGRVSPKEKWDVGRQKQVNH